MFFLSYTFSELRRRRARTVLTSLGLAVGVALVIAVSALSAGLDRAQQKVLSPLTGVGTDMSATRPIKISRNGGVFSTLSKAEQRRLRREGGGGPLNFGDVKPGSKINQDTFQATQLSFSDSQVASTRMMSGVQGAAGALTLNAVHVHGKAPRITLDQGPSSQGSGQGGAQAPSGAFGNSSLNFDARTVTGVDQTQPDLAPVTPSQVVKGSYFGNGAAGAHQAILSRSYANTKKLGVGSTIELGGTTFHVVGIASSPLGGTASDVYVELATLQKVAGYKGQINVLEVRAESTGQVSSVAARLRASLKGSEVTTAATLAKRVGGSLSDAKSLAAKLGTALEIAGLVAAILIASLLTLSSVTKRVRELGTLKALGWSSFQVVRQISVESLLQGLLGALAGIGLGIAAVTAINAVGWTLRATVAGAGSPIGGGAAGGGGPFGLGQAQVTSGSTLVKLTTSADARLILIGVVLAIAGGLAAGMAGGLRAARLRPAVALRTVE